MIFVRQHKDVLKTLEDSLNPHKLKQKKKNPAKTEMSSFKTNSSSCHPSHYIYTLNCQGAVISCGTITLLYYWTTHMKLNQLQMSDKVCIHIPV